MRLFVAIDLPDPVLDALGRLQDGLPVGRATSSETLHLTLAFLGERDAHEAEAVHAELAAIRAAPFSLSLRGVDTFGGRAPQIVFAGVRSGPELLALHQMVRGAARRAGITLPRERYRPHVTIGRIRHAAGRAELARLAAFLQGSGAFESPAFEVDAFTLYRSTLGDGPPIHDPLATYALEGD